MKKNPFCIILCAVVLIAWIGIGVAQQSKIPPEVWQKAQTEGVVRVIVGLDGPTKLPQPWTPQTMLGHQQVIAAIQDELLAELAGTRHKVRRKFQNTPGISLEVGPDALSVLERSPRVTDVEEARVEEPHLSESAPF